MSTLSETGHASINSAMLLKPVFLVEMLPYLSFPMYVFYFIEGGVEYLPFKKMNRKFLVPKKVGVRDQ